MLKVGFDELEEFLRDRSKAHFICNLQIPGPNLWLTRLELLHFPPRTKANRVFVVHNLDWNETLWAVLSIPREAWNKAQDEADRVGLRFVPGKPIMLQPGKLPAFFPVGAGNVFTVEYAPGSGLATIAATAAGCRYLQEVERRDIGRLHEAYGASLRAARDSN